MWAVPGRPLGATLAASLFLTSALACLTSCSMTTTTKQYHPDGTLKSETTTNPPLGYAVGPDGSVYPSDNAVALAERTMQASRDAVVEIAKDAINKSIEAQKAGR